LKLSAALFYPPTRISPQYHNLPRRALTVPTINDISSQAVLITPVKQDLDEKISVKSPTLSQNEAEKAVQAKYYRRENEASLPQLRSYRRVNAEERGRRACA